MRELGKDKEMTQVLPRPLTPPMGGADSHGSHILAVFYREVIPCGPDWDHVPRASSPSDLKRTASHGMLMHTRPSPPCEEETGVDQASDEDQLTGKSSVLHTQK